MSMDSNIYPRNAIILRINIWVREKLLKIHSDLYLINNKVCELENINEFSHPLSHSLFTHNSLDALHYYIMALEDRRFLHHCGIDIKAFFRELCQFKRKRYGASTIDMQLVRTITNFREKTLKRKLYESLLAFLINIKYNKRQIIDCYLNNAFFGSTIYGIERLLEILEIYDVNQVNEEIKAEIASMLKYPRPLHNTKNKNKLEKWKVNLQLRAIYAQKTRIRVK
ncbi:biosynthetic peptidoglycan transglycosylase [Snodgrassella communis]|jgi:monofunctional glycosyltransferase|uniref:biosynthetic peptidoglycan transglycosylase n=1 Tax=Snodgrassella communis TaxID=2946699 RepID=UPI0009B8C759|nr:biosynthetic peptidoglycan transglycosylase [Snodgrassella communis]